MLLHVLDLCGVAVFAISGVASARRAGMDIFGILVIAVITAIGGGTLRDLLLGRQPVFWVQDAAYLIVITGAVAATLVYVRWWTTPTQLLDLADTGGLALFTVGGTQTALSLGTPWHAAIVMGMLSGCAGGILRDVLCGEVPYLLRREVYATAALAGSGLYILLLRLETPEQVAAVVAMLTVAAIRLITRWRNWHLPAFSPGAE
ncbi:MAG: trimeric intracellular cation channel family protein [Thermomicrobiales bacterium]